LERIAQEKAELEARLAELDARASEISPRTGRPAKAQRDFDSKVVRAWALEHGYDVAPIGRVPQDIVDAWRQANTSRIGAQ
jgi:hypothetical protein